MPSISIDTFFACTLIIAVTLTCSAFLVNTLQTNIVSTQDLNKESYLKNIADTIVAGCGSPVDWGSSNTSPSSFGLASTSASYVYTLDVDKISRLDYQNIYSISYVDAFNAARLNNIALGISVAQMLLISISCSGNRTVGDQTTYDFDVSVSQNSAAVATNLHAYIVAHNFLSEGNGETSNSGIGNVSIQIPNSSNGTALLVVFARAKSDDRLTAYETFSFTHLIGESLPNRTFMGLSPINNTLTLTTTNYANITKSEFYAFSYTYQSNLTRTSENIYQIPNFLDNSPIVLVVSGLNGTSYFAEWTAYPCVPLNFGANFSNSEENAFVYIVAIKGAFYKLTIGFGDVVN